MNDKKPLLFLRSELGGFLVCEWQEMLKKELKWPVCVMVPDATGQQVVYIRRENTDRLYPKVA